MLFCYSTQNRLRQWTFHYRKGGRDFRESGCLPSIEVWQRQSKIGAHLNKEDPFIIITLNNFNKEN